MKWIYVHFSLTNPYPPTDSAYTYPPISWMTICCSEPCTTLAREFSFAVPPHSALACRPCTSPAEPTLALYSGVANGGKRNMHLHVYANFGSMHCIRSVLYCRAGSWCAFVTSTSAQVIRHSITLWLTQLRRVRWLLIR